MFSRHDIRGKEAELQRQDLENGQLRRRNGMRGRRRNESVCAFVSLDVASELHLTGPASYIRSSIKVSVQISLLPEEQMLFVLLDRELLFPGLVF